MLSVRVVNASYNSECGYHKPYLTNVGTAGTTFPATAINYCNIGYVRYKLTAHKAELQKKWSDIASTDHNFLQTYNVLTFISFNIGNNINVQDFNW